MHDESGPVFVHAWWRSASTYVWAKLRQDNELCCYYEPLHESIAKLTPATIRQAPNIKARELLRHPEVDRDYFAEYADPLRLGKLRYVESLAYERYLLFPGQADPQLHSYLEGLIDSAAQIQRRPVFAFCRSQMRSAWMKKAFGGYHVAQIRNPIDQWNSLLIYPYFTTKMLFSAVGLRALVPGAFRHIPKFDRLANALLAGRAISASEMAKYTLSENEMFALLVSLWIALSLQTISIADQILDVDRLTGDEDYRSRAEKGFAAAGCRVDFSDCAVPSAQRPEQHSDLLARVEEAVGAVSAGTIPIPGLPSFRR
eukprot:gene19694-20158_t